MAASPVGGHGLLVLSFTCLTTTKVQILAPEERSATLHSLLGTELQILTPEEL